MTLTYSDCNLVWGSKRATLVPKDLELFWKHLRKQIGPVRYFAAGEYGEETQRPHYHACVFGLELPDKELAGNRNGVDYYRSDLLDFVWPLGKCIVGEVNFESAAYVARYICGKKNGVLGEAFYREEGVEPEFVRMSRDPGIGSGWIEKYEQDVFTGDICVVRGKECKPPRFYDKFLRDKNPGSYERVKSARKKAARLNWRDNTTDRLRVREIRKKSRLKLLFRGL